MITKPLLPPKAGYVEHEKPDGSRYYEPTMQTEKEMALETENALLKAQLQAQTERSDFIEDCIAEMAMQVYAQ